MEILLEKSMPLEKGTHAQNEVQHTDTYFTLLNFTAMSREPVLRFLILAGVGERQSVEAGIYPFAM